MLKARNNRIQDSFSSDNLEKILNRKRCMSGFLSPFSVTPDPLAHLASSESESTSKGNETLFHHICLIGPTPAKDPKEINQPKILILFPGAPLKLPTSDYDAMLQFCFPHGMHTIKDCKNKDDIIQDAFVFTLQQGDSTNMEFAFILLGQIQLELFFMLLLKLSIMFIVSVF